MHYFDADVWYLINGAPVLSLGRQTSALRLLRRAAQAVDTYKSVLSQYPFVQCEPLDFHYICLQSLGALDELLFRDLMTEATWRGVVWGAWLVGLSPDLKYRD